MCSIVHITGFEFGGVFLMLSEKKVMHRENPPTRKNPLTRMMPGH